MKARILIVFFATLCGILVSIDTAIAGDTGTYEILEYRVDLVPHPDGFVDITYYQKWQVTGGHIPWITVGVPNSSFQIDGVKNNGTIKAIAPKNSSGWSGVRLDLDQDYQKDAQFEVSFAIRQNQLFYADKDSFQMEFVPGWYDNAFIKNLKITVKIFAKMESVIFNPPIAAKKDGMLVWTKDNLGKGEHFEISIAFPKEAFPGGIKKENLKSDDVNVGTVVVIIVAIIVILVIIMLILVNTGVIGGGGSGYSGGGIFYGGDSSGSGGGRSSGGGGGFGGSGYSCACACVSCACACACAGGGGAGCSRKLRHSCPICQGRLKS